MPVSKDLTEAKKEGGTASNDVSFSETIIAGRYVLGCKLGSGNFGTAYVVQDHKVGDR